MEKLDLESVRVLIVDDASDIHYYVRKALDWGVAPKSQMQILESFLFDSEETAPPEASALPRLRIDSAYNGRQAIEMVTKALNEQDPYRMVFMDVRMPPGIDGIETTHELWRIQPDLKVVLCSAYSDYSIEAMTNKLGLSEKILFLPKPCSVEALKESAVTMLNKMNFNRPPPSSALAPEKWNE